MCLPNPFPISGSVTRSPFLGTNSSGETINKGSMSAFALLATGDIFATFSGYCKADVQLAFVIL
jgi:hypothetical protein